MLSDDLEEYSKKSAPLQQENLQKMMKEMNIQIAPGSLKSTLNAQQQFGDTLKTKKCENKCKNDVLLDNLHTFFNLMKKRPTLKTNKSPPPKITNVDESESSKMCIDDSTGDLVFNMKFKGKHVFDENTSNNQQYQPTFGNQQFHSRTAQNHQNDIPKPVDTFSPYNPYNPKRKTDNDIGESSSKRPSYLPKVQQQENESNSYTPQNDFRTATEELYIQQAKKYGTGNQNDNAPYNVNPSGGIRKTLGGRRLGGRFVSPMARSEDTASSSNQGNQTSSAFQGMDMNHPRLKNVDSKMIEAIQNEIVTKCDLVGEFQERK